MSTLATLASDCIESILFYLDGNNIQNLLSTGSPFLRAKVQSKAKILSFCQLPGSKFPFWALNLPHILSLSVNTGLSQHTYINFGDSQQLGELMASKSLLSLKLSFKNSVLPLLASYSLQSTSPLRDRFPALTALILRGIPTSKSISTLISGLPVNLTTLDLSFVPNEPRRIIIPLTALLSLPKSLTSLRMLCEFVSEEYEQLKALPQLLPPNLKSLVLGTVSHPFILDFLPSALEKVKLQLTDTGSSFVWRVSTLPPNLSSLTLNTEQLDFILDAPFPSTLKKFKVDGANFDFADLPATLQILPLSLRESRVLNMELVLQRFTQMTVLKLPHQHLIQMIPQALTKLDINAIPFPRLSEPLPRSLRELKLGHPVSEEELAFLPQNLELLEVDFKQGVFHRPQQHLAPPMSALAFSTLSLANLRELKLHIGAVFDGACLAPLKNCFLLESLFLRSITSEWSASIYTWLPSCLPSQLRSLRIAGSYTALEQENLRRCELSSVVPSLERLTVDLVVSSQENKPLGPILASLPKQLRHLCFNALDDVCEPDALSHLNHTLGSLVIYFVANSKGYLTNAHFKGLPKRLCSLLISNGNKDDIDTKIFEILPKTLSSIVIWGHKSSKDEMVAAMRKFFETNPLMSGYV